MWILVAAALGLSQPVDFIGTEDERRLVSWSVSDLAEHLPKPARAFREVHLAPLVHSDGITRNVLCGHVRIEDGAEGDEWVAFASLETSGGYEQWLGGTAGAWCNEKTPLDLDRDLSRHFERQLVPGAQAE